MDDAAKLLALLLLHLALTALPILVGSLLAARFGLRGMPLLLAVGLATSGVLAMLVFWAFYASPSAGLWLSRLLPPVELTICVICLRGGAVGRDALRGLGTPLALWAFGSGFLLFLGFLHGGTAEPLQMSATRFSGQLPPDNIIPSFFADWFFHHGHHGTPLVFPGEWLASDRPPLQIGYVLTERGFGWDGTGLRYQVLGVVLQQLWIVGLWALLAAARVGRRARALALVAVLISDVAIVNGFFVWPKLMPVAFLLAAAALMLTPLWRSARKGWLPGVLVSILLALALLAHGGSFFAVVSLLAIAAFRGIPGWRWLAAGVAIATLLLAPWIAYKSYGDPPGNRVVKWMLGGANEIDSRSVPEAIVDGYREAGPGGVLHNKAENFVAMSGGGPAFDSTRDAAESAAEGDLSEAVFDLREVRFYDLIPFLGVFVLGPLAMAWARIRRKPPPSPEWRLAVTCLLAAAIGCLLWGLLLFGDAESRTVMHQGSYAIPILALCGSVIGLWATLPRVAIGLVIANSVAVLCLYVPALTPPAGSAYSPQAALLAVGFLAAFVVWALASAEPPNTLARR